MIYIYKLFFQTAMKFMAMGDPHFRTECLDLVDRFTTQALVSFSKHKPDFVVCLGDTLHCHEKLHSAPLNKAVSFFKTISENFPLFVLVGNHVCECECFARSGNTHEHRFSGTLFSKLGNCCRLITRWFKRVMKLKNL